MATLTPHPLLAILDVAITCSLNIQTDNIDYKESFHPYTYFQPLPPFDVNPRSHFASMNILCWNTRGAASADFKRAFREMRNSYYPNLFILTETRLSDD